MLFMTPKDKASDLVYNFYEIQSNEYDYGINWDMAKQCALIAVDEIINSHDYLIDFFEEAEDYRKIEFYWIEVRKEIEKL
jgi:hypothetical protein